MARGPYAKTRARRQSIGAAALQLVSEKGHRQVSVAEVAEAVGVSEPTVFYHFPTKESLLIAALQAHDDANIRSPGAEAGAVHDMGERAEIGVQRTFYARLYNELAGAAADPDHPANEYFQQRRARSKEVVATDIRRLQSIDKVAADVDADVAAHLLLAAWSGLQLEWMHGPAFDIRAVLEEQINALLGPGALD